MSPVESLRVLVVDDDLDTQSNLRDIIELDDHHVETAGSVAEVLARRNWNGIAVVLLDRRLPDGSAEDLVPYLRSVAPEAAVTIVTGYADLQGAIAAMRQGATDYILKPIEPEALRASLRRVADRRHLARAKDQSEAAFRTLIEAAPCLIVILRPDRSVVYISRYAQSVTGHLVANVIGRTDWEALLPASQHEAADVSFRKVLSGLGIRGEERLLRCADGSDLWVLWNAQLLEEYDGGPAVLMIGQDITGLRRAQERTLQAERLAAIGQMVTGLAHESGNALARSQACLEMLAIDVQDRPEVLDLVSRLQKAQDHLKKLYEEVRRYAAPLRLQREDCRLDTVWRQAWSSLAGLRTGRSANLVEPPADISLRCQADAFRMEQVFRNVMENALAACRDPVVVTVEAREAHHEGRPALQVSVVDNGPGLGPEQRRRLFEPFYTTKTKGTGLGMAIAQRILEAHGGVITAGPSMPGRGAEILITLPREGPL